VSHSSVLARRCISGGRASKGSLFAPLFVISTLRLRKLLARLGFTLLLTLDASKLLRIELFLLDLVPSSRLRRMPPRRPLTLATAWIVPTIEARLVVAPRGAPMTTGGVSTPTVRWLLEALNLSRNLEMG
jgi:hypothetical protein